MIAKLGHDFEADFTVDEEATCHSVGTKSKHCTRCEEVTEKTEIPMTEHSYDDGTVTVPATAGQEGIKTFTCLECGYTKTESIDKLAPQITEQTFEEWNSWSEGKAVFRSNAAYEDFISVMINGEELSPEHYTLREGSIIVEIDREYLKSLESGEYKIDIVSKTGTASSNIVIDNNFTKNPAVWNAGIAIGFLIAFTAIILVKRKR